MLAHSQVVISCSTHWNAIPGSRHFQ